MTEREYIAYLQAIDDPREALAEIAKNANELLWRSRLREALIEMARRLSTEPEEGR